MRIYQPLTATALLIAMVITSGFSRPTTADEIPPRIGWYGTLQSGLAAAKRTGRPILLVSGAPHCHGVSGIW